MFNIVTRKTKIKTTIRFYLIKYIKLERLTRPCIGKNVEQLELPNIVGKNCNWYNYFGKQSDSFYIDITIQCNNSTPKFFTKWYKNVHTKTCREMLIAILFIIGKNSKLSIYLSMSECINKLWNTYTTEYCTAIKRTNYWYTWKYEWTSKTLCWRKEARHRRVHAIDATYQI